MNKILITITLVRSLDFSKLIQVFFLNDGVVNFSTLRFADAKPAVVITHGDVLSISNRAHVRLCLGELLGVPPEKQIFDIPGPTQTTQISLIFLPSMHLETCEYEIPFPPASQIAMIPKPNWQL